MSMKNHIEGVFTLKTAMFVAEFDKPGETMQKAIITPEGRFYMPYFPANDLRGKLRRAAASRIFECWKAKGLAITTSLYLGLTCGASSGNPENDKTVEEVIRANKNVYMGIFGGGTRFLRSGYRVQDLDVISQTCIDAGVVPSHFGDAVEGGFVPTEYKDGQKLPIRDGYKLMHTYGILRVDDIMRAVKIEEIEGIIEGGAASVAKYQEAVLNERVDGKAAKELAKENKGAVVEKVKRTRVENMQSIRAVTPGVPLYLRMDMTDTLLPAQTGFLILCLKDLLEAGDFGGFVRCGLGKMAVRELKLVIDGETFPVFDDAENLTLSVKSAELAKLAETEVADLTPEQMALFFNSKGE
jgi:CRISPR type IV-associated protein Csf2